ncbi:MAG: acetolactate synthase small subunit [Deltaproteobacteria bacterium GWA2_45_12]|nr:MAG: acetolactate synthase small subunit [Deltaproteobacteria bacterium GWA2_45_12]
MKHTISALVENEFGVLTRIAGLFSGRGYNIQSLTVAETLDPHVSRMTIVTSGNDAVIDQINKQLSKLVNVIKVRDMTSERAINRILALVKVKLNETNRNEVIKAVETIGGEVLDVEETYCVVEVRGDEEKIGSTLNLLKPYGILDFAQTGNICIPRGKEEEF